MIRQLIAVTILAGTVAACDENTPPTAPTPENTVRFTANMTAAQEVPPITGPEANATGTVTITFNLTRNSQGTITGGTVDFNVTLANFPAGTVINAAHIHPGFAGNTGGITVNAGVSAGEFTLANGSGSFTKNAQPLTADQAASVIANPQGFYFNVHSALNPGGAVRGQLVRQ
jgi:hypothetical protein